VKNKIQTLSFVATLAIAVGMISWGSALHAQDTTPSTPPDSQGQQPSSTPDTTPPQQTPQTSPTPSPSMPESGQTPSSQAPSSQTPDASQAPDSAAPSTRTPQTSGNASAAGTDSQTFSGTVTKSGDKYVLKDDSGKTYDIDHQDDVKKFDGKRVRVQGTLDPTGTKIMVK